MYKTIYQLIFGGNLCQASKNADISRQTLKNVLTVFLTAGNGSVVYQNLDRSREKWRKYEKVCESKTMLTCDFLVNSRCNLFLFLSVHHVIIQSSETLIH